jgi:hypothetical protein
MRRECQNKTNKRVYGTDEILEKFASTPNY